MKNAKYQIGELFAEQLENLTEIEKRDVMESVAYKISDQGYTKILSQEDLIERKDELAKVIMEIDRLEIERKSLMAEYKKLLEEPLEFKKELLTAIRTRSEFKKGMCYYVDDQETKTMYVFDEQGECIDIRPLKKEERQMKIKILKTGTDE